MSLISNIGLCLESLGLPLRRAIVAAAQLGARGVQFNAIGELSPQNLSQTGRRQLRYLIRSHEMALIAVGAPTRRGYDNLERLDDRVEQTKRVLALAAEIGAPFVINHIGKIPADDAPGDHFYDALRRIGSEAERVGSRFAVETGDNSPQHLGALLAKLSRYGLGVNYDVGNLAARGYNVYDGVRTLAHHLLGTHIKDVVPTGASVSGYTPVPLGQGEIDWEVFVGALEEIDYRGYLTLERETPAHTLDEIKADILYLKHLPE